MGDGMMVQGRSAFLKLGLIGYPLTHSLSPRLHHAALQALGLPGEYTLFAVRLFPEGERELRDLLVCLREGELHGLNVTIPHKQAVIPFLDELTPMASAIGAVNTIACREGILVGDNTDAAGFISDFARFCERPFVGSHALLLGAGGAARAVAYALSQAGCQVTVMARRFEQAQALAAQLSTYGTNATIEPIPWDVSALQPLCSNLHWLINATPVGMYPDVDANPWLEGLALPGVELVYDLIYHPPETQLLCQARQSGLKAANGLGMLIEQAAHAFERWTGYSPPRAVMWQSVQEFAGQSLQRGER